MSTIQDQFQEAPTLHFIFKSMRKGSTILISYNQAIHLHYGEILL
jgi:hypothetical protein